MQENDFPALLLQFFLRSFSPCKSFAASEAVSVVPYVFFQIAKRQPVRGY